MALNLRQKQTSCIARMLNLNQQSSAGSTAVSSASAEEVYKILVLDRFCRDILSPLIHVKELRKHGITLYLIIDNERQTVPDVPAIYFVLPTAANINRIMADVSRGIYESFHLNFSSSLPRPLLEELAAGVLKADAVSRIAKIYDQYLEFVTLEENLFSLAQPDVYVQLNDPSARDQDIENILEKIAGGLFGVLATLGVVPVIRCASGGPAQMVAASLDSRLRDHLVTKHNLFSESGNLVNSFQRPILCLFDRNFELAVAVQHDWSYRSLVHDVFDMKLNKVSVKGEKSLIKSYELDDSDLFWFSNCWSPFEKIAFEIDSQLSKYKQDVEEVNRRTGGSKGAEFDGTDLIGNTKHLMNAVNSLPELTERKKMIDKHTNIATALLGEIKNRALDSFCSLESEMSTKGIVDKNQLINQLKDRGTKEDKLRLAITYLISMETTPQSELESIEAALRESEVDMCAFLYVKKIKSLNMSMNSYVASSSKSNIVDWAEKLYGQSLSAVTAGMKNLLSGGRQIALTRTVEALMEGKPNPEVDSYLLYDPRAPRSGAGAELKGTFKQAIVFMIGGGNYVEYRSLMELAQRSQPPKHIMYGTTEILNGVEFAQQLQVLGQKMGLGNNVVNPNQ